MLRIHAHQLGLFWWCGEACRLVVMEGRETRETSSTIRGRRIHEWLATRPLTFSERRLWHKLEPYRGDEGFGRYVEDLDVMLLGNPDDLRVKGRRVWIEEYKTLDRDSLGFWMMFRRPCAEYQTQTYIYILTPILGELGYQLSRRGYIWLFDESGRVMKVLPTRFIEEYYLIQLERIVKMLRGEEEMIPPHRFKCRQCEFREVCRIWVSENSEK